MHLGRHEFEARYLMPDYRSESHPGGAVLELTPQKPDLDFERLLREDEQEIVDLARRHMALVFCMGTAIGDRAWKKIVSEDDRIPLSFHVDGSGEAIILVSPVAQSVKRAATFVAEYENVKRAMKAHKSILRLKLGNNLDEVIDLLDLTEGLSVEATLFKITHLVKECPHFMNCVVAFLRHRRELYEHNWANRGKSILVMPNIKYEEEGGRWYKMVTHVHARAAYEKPGKMDPLFRRPIGLSPDRYN